jgi:hypothetical protein
LQAEADESGRARTAAEEALRKQRVESREVESEHSRLEVEGPASHRKKDMLDKATKEVCGCGCRSLCVCVCVLHTQRWQVQLICSFVCTG